MKNIDVKIFNEKLKKYNVNLVIWIVVIGIAVGFLVAGIMESNKEIKYTYLNDLILKNEDNTLKNAYLDVYTEPYVFAEYEDEESKFYIVMDAEYMYIVYLTPELYNEIMNSNLEEKSFKIKGYTESTSDDVKALAIESYNELIEEELITNANFDSYFGSIYLNTTGIHDNSVVWYMLALITGIIGICGLGSIINYKNKSKKQLNELTQNELKNIIKELDSEECNKYVKEQLYLTKTYIISLMNQIDIIRYKDIVWMYKQDYRTRGIKTNQGIIVATKDGIKHNILMVRNTKKAKKIFNDTWEILSLKLPNILIGYTKENQTKAKEQYNIK